MNFLKWVFEVLALDLRVWIGLEWVVNLCLISGDFFVALIVIRDLIFAGI